MGTIPASIDVKVIPAVVGAGGTALATIGLFLDDSTTVPISPLGSVLSFASAAAVSAYFGAASPQAAKASVYFNGFEGRTAIPAAMLITQYPAIAVSAYVRGGAPQTLAQLQAFTAGSLTVTMDGYASTISSINLSGDASYSAIAAALTAAFTEPTEASFTGSMGSSFTATGSGTDLTVSALASGYISAGDVITGTGVPASTTIVSQTSGTPGGVGVYVTSQATTASAASITGTSSVIDVTVVASGTLAVGQTVSGGTIAAGTLITSQISGAAGGVGLYGTMVNGVATKQSVASASLTAKATAPIVSYSCSSGFVVTSGITGAASTAAFATGTLAGPLGLTSATGAVLSQGAAQTTPAAFMAAVTAQTQNFLSFTTMFDPDAAYFTGTISGTTLTIDALASGAPAIGDVLSGPGVTAGTLITAGSGTSWTVSVSQTVSASVNMKSWAAGGGHGNTQKLAFAAWNNSVPDQFAYAMWDTDAAPTISASATGSAGYIATITNQYEGVTPIYEPSDLYHAAFVMGAIASVDFGQTDGRTNMKFRTQAGLTAGVTSQQIASNLDANGYNYVGAVATASQQLIYLRNGTISGKFKYIDSFVNQAWLNSQMQLTLLDLLTTAKSIPYNNAGYNMIYTSLAGGAAGAIALPPAGPIAAALNFGAIRPNVPLSAAQAEEVNAAAGTDIASVLGTRGWYLQILPASPTVRAQRGTPPANLWYMDGESVNQITLNSINVQ